MSDDFQRGRTGFASAASTLPKDFLDGNAERLFLIGEELRRSFGAEMAYIRRVADLRVEDPAELQREASQLQWERQTKAFDRERTHCHNIDRLYTDMTRPYSTGAPQDDARLASFDKLVEPLRGVDNEILDDLEALVGDAYDTAAAMSAAVGPPGHTGPRNLDGARALQTAFLARTKNRTATAMASLRELTRLAEELIDTIGRIK